MGKKKFKKVGVFVMFGENMFSKAWKKRYAAQSDEIKKQLDDLSDALGGNFKEFQLKVIKRKRIYPQKGDVFVLSPREGIYFYGLVVNSDVININSDGEKNPLYVIAIFKNKTNSLENIGFTPDFDNLLIDLTMVSRGYWTGGYFYNVGHIDMSKLDIDYGFYDIFDHVYLDEYENKLHHIPKILGMFSVKVMVGVAYEINTELIIDPSLLD